MTTAQTILLPDDTAEVPLPDETRKRFARMDPRVPAENDARRVEMVFSLIKDAPGARHGMGLSWITVADLVKHLATNPPTKAGIIAALNTILADQPAGVVLAAVEAAAAKQAAEAAAKEAAQAAAQEVAPARHS